METAGKYLYGVIQAKERREFGAWGIGERGDPLYTVHWEDLACVVSDSPLELYPVTRNYTMSHYKAIEAIWRECPALLPVRFSTVARSEEEIIERLLKPRRDEFLRLLQWVADKQEVGVRAFWPDMESVFAGLLQENPDLGALKAELAKRPPAGRYYEQIELGKRVEAALQAKRERIREHILQALGAHAVDTRQDPVYGDYFIASAAFLMPRPDLPAYAQALRKLQDFYGSSVLFKTLEEGAPFHFVEVHVSWEVVDPVSHR